MAIFREIPNASDPEVVSGDDRTDVGDVSQGRLMYRRFKQSKLAVAGAFVLIVMYLLAIFAPFLSPNSPTTVYDDWKNAPPSQLTWDGGLAMCDTRQVLNEQDFKWETVTDCDNAKPLEWFSKGPEYKMLWLFETDIHLVTAPEGQRLFFWGADEQGRDVFTRTLYGGQVSLTIGLLGVGIATILATLIGTISGYFAGWVDNVIQRVIEVVTSIPTLPLWATLAALLPNDMPVEWRFFYISLILSLVAWAGLARQVRGKVMGFAGTDYVHAARAAGGGHFRIIVTHMVPNGLSHVIAATMLAIPGAIIAETSLSFLGIGMVEPAVSWGVLLEGAQRINVITTYPWMLIPAIPVILAVTAYQLLGDGVRDAVDPYG